MNLIDKAWELYCEETAGWEDAVPFWHRLGPNAKEHYVLKAMDMEEGITPEDVAESDFPTPGWNNR